MKIVFLGTPRFAAASLQALIDSSHEVCAVITQPDRASGRGLKKIPSPVKSLAQSANIKVYQPEKLNSKGTMTFLNSSKADILVLVAYGEILKEEILNYGAYRPINLHPSLLPDLRGAAPLQWALLRGYTETGISTQYMVRELDAGEILLQKKISIGENENSMELQERIQSIGGKLLVKTLEQLEQGSVIPKPQDEALVSFAPQLKKSMSPILWEKRREQIHNHVRGLTPWPGAITYCFSNTIKILKTRIPREMDDLLPKKEPGAFSSLGEQLFVQCGDAHLEILRLQPSDKRALLPQEFTNGIRGKGISTKEWYFSHKDKGHGKNYKNSS